MESLVDGTVMPLFNGIQLSWWQQSPPMLNCIERYIHKQIKKFLPWFSQRWNNTISAAGLQHLLKKDSVAMDTVLPPNDMRSRCTAPEGEGSVIATHLSELRDDGLLLRFWSNVKMYQWYLKPLMSLKQVKECGQSHSFGLAWLTFPK
jgi:hypothetical protein